MWQSKVGAEHRSTVSTRLDLVIARAEAKGDATQLAEVESLLQALGSAPQRIEALLLRARLAAQQGQQATAEAALVEARELIVAADPSSPEAPRWSWMEGRAILALGQQEAAKNAFMNAATAYQASDREDHPGRGRALLHAARLSPIGSAERQSLHDQAAMILRRQLLPPAASLELLESN